jgi:hypothetical protein
MYSVQFSWMISPGTVSSLLRIARMSRVHQLKEIHMKTSTVKQAGLVVLQACAIVMLLNAPGVRADEFGDDPPICMKRPHLPQCNPDPFDPPPQEPWYGCGWL